MESRHCPGAESESRLYLARSLVSETTSCLDGIFRDVDTIADRLRWILANRRAPDGEQWNAKSLSIAAGLSSNHVGQFIRSTVKGGNNATLMKIARAANVNPLWLTSGAGGPDDEHAPTASEDPTPVMANLVGWREVAKVDRFEHPDITDEEERAAERAAAFLLHRPPVEGDLWELVQQLRRMNDPSVLAQKLAAHQARVRALIAQLPEQVRREQEALSAKARKGRTRD